MASTCSSKLTRSRPPSASPNSLDHGLQVHLQTHSNMASKCISRLAQSCPPHGSSKSLNHGLQLHLESHSIAASNCISKVARSQPPCASPTSLDYSLQVYLLYATVPDRHFGSGSRSNPNRCQIGSPGCEKPKLSTQVWFDAKLPTSLNWAGCQRVAQRVHP